MMREYKIQELSLLTAHGQIEAKFQVILRKQVYVLTENWYRVVRGAVFIWNARLKMYQIYSNGLFEAIRGTKHAMKGYGLSDAQLDEYGELHQLTLSRSAISVLLRQIWNYRKLSDRQRDDYATGCLALFKELELVQDEGKATARDRLGRAHSVIDSLGRYNPPSRAPMLWSSADKLEQRQINIRDIARWVDIRQFVLLVMLDEVYDTVTLVYDQTAGLAKNVLARNPGCTQLGMTDDLIRALEQPVVLPFRRGFSRTVTDLESVRKLVSRSTLSPAETRQIHRLFDRAQRAMALYMIRRDLEPLVWRLSSELAKRKVNRQPVVLDEVLQDLVKFCNYIESIIDFDKMFRHPILPRMHHHLCAVIKAGGSNDWPAARQELASATVMF